jgi:predicted DNA binding protein
MRALELGYYETPREATHTNVAERLDCAPNTATEHL